MEMELQPKSAKRKDRKVKKIASCEDRDFDRIIGDEIDDNVVVDEGRKSQRSVALAASIQKGSLFLSWLTSSDNILMDVCELSSIHAPTIIDHLILVARHMQCVRNEFVFSIFLFVCLFCFVLFCFVLFCFSLLCHVLFCFVLFCFVLFCFFLNFSFLLVEQPQWPIKLWKAYFVFLPPPSMPTLLSILSISEGNHFQFTFSKHL